MHTDSNVETESTPWRVTTQDLAPERVVPTRPGQYDVYPAFPIGSGKIDAGWIRLAEQLAGHGTVVIDGYVGVFWDHLRRKLGDAFSALGIAAGWTSVADALRPEEEIEALVAPFLGGEDPIFGDRYTGRLDDFFDPDQLNGLRPDPEADVNLIYGCGAALAGWDGTLVYLDVPKNEIQFRLRAGAVCNLGTTRPVPPKKAYKRFYFVDWIVLNRHKAGLLPHIDLVVDEQRPDAPVFMKGADLRESLGMMGRNFFRVRPWFEPGPWGGQWMKKHFPQLSGEAPNYAWSFELITPENGLAFESDGRVLEVSFDLLMFQEHHAVLGKSAAVFGFEFPIRFDFLDTFDGGKLSVQCHPRPDYIREHFGESFTQDETYYILDCQPGARVYLGFQEDIDPVAFRAALEKSFSDGVEVDIERFVRTHPASKHDLFLIPNGTIHCSGIDNMVLEISATPYIFTFKMYDWLRLDLDGRPRPLNIERAFANLNFGWKGTKVETELISRPYILEKGEDWQLVHLPTHHEHFYDVHRYEFSTRVEGLTEGSCHVMSLVEGESVILETENGLRQRFNYAETFVVPAAAGRYWLINESTTRAKVVKAFVKPGVNSLNGSTR